MSKEVQTSFIGSEDDLLSTIIVPESEHRARIQGIPLDERKEYNRRLIYWKKQVNSVLESDHHFPNIINFNEDLIKLPGELRSEPKLPGFIYDGLFGELIKYPIPIPLQSIEDQIKQKGSVTWEEKEWEPKSLLQMFLNKWNSKQKELIDKQDQFTLANIAPKNPLRYTLFNKPGRKYDDEFQQEWNYPVLLLAERREPPYRQTFESFFKRGLLIFDIEEINSVSRRPLLFCPRNNYMFIIYDLSKVIEKRILQILFLKNGRMAHSSN